MNALRISATGMPVLDSLLGGGFLSNSVVTISHQPSVANYWELVYRMAISNFDSDFYSILVTFRFSIEEYLNRVKFSAQNDPNFAAIVENGLSGIFSVIDCFNVSEGEEDSRKGNVYYVSNPFNANNLLSVMSNVRERVPEGKHVLWIFFDLTDMNIGLPEDEVVKFCRRAFRYHKQRGDQALYFLNEKAQSNTFFAKIYQLSDVFIKLIAEETSWGLTSAVQVIKSVFPFQSKKVFYDIDENGKLQFLKNKPENKPKKPTSNNILSGKAGGEDLRLFRTGIPSFDSLLGGGMFLNSIIVGSHQYGVRILEPSLQLFRDKFGEKTHVIQVNYHYSPDEYEIRSKILRQKAEIHELPAKSFSTGKLSVIDCFNIKNNETEKDNEKSNNNIYPLSNPFNTDKLLSIMTRVRSSIPEDMSAFWIFTDLTDMSIGVSEDEVLKFCRRAFRYHKWCGDMAIYTLNEQAHTERFLAKLYQLSDVFIKFIGEDTREGIDTSIQILKSSFNFNSKKAKYLLDEKGNMQFAED
ncbi:MAG: hypothetical protein WED07_15125 [Candidatus Freyarchaeum deiterrae]